MSALDSHMRPSAWCELLPNPDERPWRNGVPWVCVACGAFFKVTPAPIPGRRGSARVWQAVPA